MNSTTYWNLSGKHQNVVAALEAMIPDTGPVPRPFKNKALERFRKAGYHYYRLYNDGDFGAGAGKMFKVQCPAQYHSYRTTCTGKRYRAWNPGLYSAVETAMDEIIAAAAVEQGLSLE